MSSRTMRRRRLWGRLAVIALTLPLAACGPDWGQGREDPEEIVEPIQVQLAGQTFVSESVAGHELVPDTAITLAFTDDGLSASAGCNTMQSGWTEDRSVIAWTGEPLTTLMACTPELEEQDRWLADLLTEGVTVEDGDADLTLVSGDVTIELSDVTDSQ